MTADCAVLYIQVLGYLLEDLTKIYKVFSVRLAGRCAPLTYSSRRSPSGPASTS